MSRPRSDAAREKMLTAAADLVLERGVAGFSVLEVARRSGVAKTTITRHFPDARMLLLAAVDSTVTYPEPPDTGTLRGDVLETLRRIRPNFVDRRATAVHHEVFAAMSRDPDLQRLNREFLDATHPSPVGTIWKRWRDRGEIRADIDFATAFEIIDGPFTIRSIVFPETLEDLDLEQLTDRILMQLVP